MKKRILPILLPLVLLLCMGNSSAVIARAPAISPRIAFDANTVNCSASITAVGKSIDATLELWEGNTLLDSWSGSGSSALVLEGSHSAVSGHTYTVKVHGTIGGSDFTATPFSRTCP